MSTTMPVAQNAGNRGMLIRHQRRASRGFAMLALAISAGGQDYVGFLRDISSAGLFFYSKIMPCVGAEIHLVISVSAVDPKLTVGCKCRVVRVEPGLAGAATGVGVTIEGYWDR